MTKTRKKWRMKVHKSNKANETTEGGTDNDRGLKKTKGEKGHSRKVLESKAANTN